MIEKGYGRRRSTCSSCCNTHTNNAPSSSVSGKSCGLLSQLRRIDFALVEINLYLDAYPHCEKGLAYFHKLNEEREKLLAELSAEGRPVTARDSKNTTYWDWTDAPWPWHPDGN